MDAERSVGEKLVGVSVVKQQCQQAGAMNGHIRIGAAVESSGFAACKPSKEIVKNFPRARSSVDSRLIVTETIKVKK